MLSASEAIETASRSTFAVSRSLLGACVDESERHLEHREDDDGEREVADQQPARHARSRRPTPRTVSISVGSPSFLRNAATCTSTVFDEPYQVVSQTSRRIRWRSTTTPGSEASSARRSNSFSVSCSSRPSSVARRARHVDLELADDERLAMLGAARRAAGHGADPRDELAQAEGLDDVVVGAQLEPDDAVDLLALRGDHDDRHVGAGAQLPADRETVDVRQPNVEQDEVGRRRVERRLPGGDTGHLEAFRHEPLDERLRDRVFVLDDEQVHALIVGARAATRRLGRRIWRNPCLRLAHGLPGEAYLQGHISHGGRSMNRIRALIVSLAVGVAAVAGVFALGAHSRAREPGACHDDRQVARAPRSSTATKRRSTRLWRRRRRSCRPCRRRRPRRSAAAPPERAGRRVVYHRPPPIVVSSTAPAASTSPRRREPRPMTDTSHRLYAVVVAVVVFFVSWAAVAARPWATAKPDPRLAALAQREQRLRADAKLVRQVVDARMTAYRMALKARQAQIAAVKAQAALRRRVHCRCRSRPRRPPVAAAPAVRVVNLPPLTITRTS